MLLSQLTSILNGDEVAAEFLLLHLISRMYDIAIFIQKRKILTQIVNTDKRDSIRATFLWTSAIWRQKRRRSSETSFPVSSLSPRTFHSPLTI